MSHEYLYMGWGRYPLFGLETLVHESKVDGRTYPWEEKHQEPKIEAVKMLGSSRLQQRHTPWEAPRLLLYRRRTSAHIITECVYLDSYTCEGNYLAVTSQQQTHNQRISVGARDGPAESWISKQNACMQYLLARRIPHTLNQLLIYRFALYIRSQIHSQIEKRKHRQKHVLQPQSHWRVFNLHTIFTWQNGASALGELPQVLEDTLLRDNV